jgi:carbonic anhydrase
MSMAESARERALSLRDASPRDRQQCCEQDVIKVSLKNLMTFPWIAAPVTAGRLRLHGAWFSIRSGELMVLRPDGSFTRAE